MDPPEGDIEGRCHTAEACPATARSRITASERGYARFTIDGVSARAGTSRPVIYRRWPTRSDLAIATIRHQGRKQPVATPDTGSVRDDLIAVLRDASAARSEVAALISVQMAEYFTETGRTPADIRAEFLSGRQQPFSIDDLAASTGGDNHRDR